MKKLLCIAALLAVSLVATQESEAKGSPSSGNHQGNVSHSYPSTHRNWSHTNWNSRYGCYFYTCPRTFCQYYWYAPSCCYYPIAYVAQFPPTVGQPVAPAPAVATTVQVTNTNINTASVGTPGIAAVTPGLLPKGP